MTYYMIFDLLTKRPASSEKYTDDAQARTAALYLSEAMPGVILVVWPV